MNEKITKLTEKKEKLKEFYSHIFDYDTEGNLTDNCYIRVFTTPSNAEILKPRVKFFKNINEMIDWVFQDMENFPKGWNYYFNLGATDGKGGKAENIVYRKCIGLDFDKKDYNGELTHKQVCDKYKEYRLNSSATVSSGNGFHFYTFINKTDNLDKLEELQKCLAYRLGADKKACLKTQVLRIPYTFNVKSSPIHVNLVHCFSKDKMFYDNLDNLHKRYVTDKYLMELENGLAESENKPKNGVKLITDRLYPCMRKAIKNGAEEGNRQDTLLRLVVNLKSANYPYEEIEQLTREFNNNCIPSMNEKELEYQVHYIYDHVNYAEYECKYCDKDTKKYCFSNFNNEEFEINDNTEPLKLTEKAVRVITKSNKRKKGVKTMEGNNLVIYCLLVYNNKPMSVTDIIEELAYRNNKIISERTLRDVLRALESDKLLGIDTVGNTKYYRALSIRAKEDCTFKLSSAAMFECIKGFITPQEFRIYGYLRYALNKQNREQNNQKRKNIIRIEQTEIAKALDIDQSRVSRAIDNLIAEKLVTIWDTKISKSNGMRYYIYRLNY